MIVDVHGHFPPEAGMFEAILESARANGVKRMVISDLAPGWPPQPTAQQVAEANKEAFGVCKRYPDFLRAYIYLSPRIDWEPEVRRWRGNRFLAGVKLWIDLKDAEGSPRICEPVLHYAASERLPVLIHASSRVGGNLPGEVCPAEVAALARAVPQAKVIMAHCGGNFEKGLWAIRDVKNVSTDIAGGMPLRGQVECAVKTLGAERVLFGTDAPFRTVQCQVAKLLYANVSERAKQKIFYKNALKLFAVLADL